MIFFHVHRVNKLVRYQGIIQDIFNPEYYTAGISLNYAKEEANYSDRFILGKYKEHLHSLPLDQDLDSDSVVTMERLQSRSSNIIFLFIITIGYISCSHEGL